MRDLYFLYEKEGLVDPEAVEEWIQNEKRPIQAMGAFRPLKVIHKNSEDVNLKAVYDKFVSLLSKKNTDEAVKFIDKKGYFVVAEYNEARHQRFSDMEQSLAEDFLGKYWIRPFNDGTRYTYDAPDGNVSYYSGGSEIQFPFINKLPSSIQKASDFLQDIIESSEGPSDNLTNLASQGKFLMMERTAVWSPAKNSDTIEKLLENIEPFGWSPTDFDQSDLDGTPLASVAQDIFSPGVEIFIAYPKPEKLDLEITKSNNQTQRNPLDAKNVRSASKELNGFNVSYGLVSAETTYFVVKANGAAVQIHAPSQAGLKFGSDYGGYQIVADGTNFANDISVVVAKKEVVLGDSQPISSLSISSELILKDATQNLINFLQSTGKSSCQYDETKIRQLLLKFNARQKAQKNIERVTKTYEISGIPSVKLTPADGLQSFSVIVSDSGVRTTVSFSNLPNQNRSEAIEEKKFEELGAILGQAKKYFKK